MLFSLAIIFLMFHVTATSGSRR